MNYATQNTEIRARFNSIWANRIPVDHANMKFTAPIPSALWCRFRISGGDGKRTTIGAPTNNYRNTGIVYIQLFAPIETGDGTLFQRADEAANIFRDWCGTNIICRTPVVKDVGPDGLGYYQVNVSIPFVRNQIL
jgi:Bacteriophage related domain of unknown function